MRGFLLATAALVGGIVLPVAAEAAPINETRFAEQISHNDLDLAKSDDAARLEERVRNRIRQLCQNGGRDGASLRLERECRSSALADAGHQVRVAIANARADRVRFAERAPSPASPAATPGA
jgi:UrcA family protein